ncbi:MAG TPA: Ig-like domain-containing protein [Tepidisphaeraceae bacterium]|nr:Ig-like domain-containing protein [Tepidisphaeraceae bacterium]
MSRRPRPARSLVETLEVRRLLAADFTVVAMGDSQYIVEDFPQIFAAQTQWARDNATNPAHNVAFVAHQGDMLRRGYSDFQAGNAQAALDKLNGVVPYTVSIGNHDYDNQFDDLDRHVSSANFAEHFGDVMFARQNAANTAVPNASGFGRSSLDQRNRYQIITTGDAGARQQYMVLSLEWAAPDSSIKWAKDVIAANPNLPVILSTHEYLNGSGRTTSTLDPIGNSGSALWTKLVNVTPQIFLVLSGHTGANFHQTSTNAAGLPVHEAVVDFEGVAANGGNGFMQLFHFFPGQNKIGVSTYSPYTGQTLTGANYTFDLPLDFSTRFNFNNTPVPFSPFSNTPVAIEDAATTDEGKAVTLNPVANDTDPDGDAVKAILSSLPANGAVYVNANGTFTYTPDPKFVGIDTFKYYPIDGAVRGVETTVTVTVNDTDARYSYPVAETTSAGTRTGTFADLAASDGVIESVTGSTVTQQWRFTVTGGTEATFAVNAWRDWASHEYRFQYSTNGTTWAEMTPMVSSASKAVTRTRFDAAEPYQMWRLPASTNGTVYIKPIVDDSDTLGWRLRADEMFIMTTGTVPAPAAPTSLTASYAKNSRKATLKWADRATNETGYKVWYSTDGVNFSVYTTLGANSTQYTTNALTRGVRYYFKVSAFNAGGDSLFSNTVNILAS